MSGAREVSGARTSVLVRYLRRVYGAELLARVLELGAPERTPAQLEDLNAWFSEAESNALFEAAESLTGDRDIGRSTGEEVLREHFGTEVVALLRSLGSPGELLRNIATTAAKYSDSASPISSAKSAPAECPKR